MRILLYKRKVLGVAGFVLVTFILLVGTRHEIESEEWPPHH